MVKTQPTGGGMMKILVCVKQVPLVEGIAFRGHADGAATLEVFEEFRMNRFDEFAVEQAVRFKETVPGAQIDVITAGPHRAEDVLRRAMGMGCDEGVHLRTATDSDPGPAVVAAWIAQFARPRKYGMILCGSMTEDGMHGQVGPVLAAYLDLPYATQAIAAELTEDRSRLSVEREIEGGARERLAIRLPALLTVQSGINRPRYPSLSNLLRAHRQVLETVSTDTLEPAAPPVDCLGMVMPAHRRASQRIQGTAYEKAEYVAALLKSKALI
jgi:electron transfer flavoprotein beta subunit